MNIVYKKNIVEKYSQLPAYSEEFALKLSDKKKVTARHVLFGRTSSVLSCYAVKPET